MITSADIGARIERAARFIAPIIAAVYAAGLMTGRLVHQLNDRLAVLVRRQAGFRVDDFVIPSTDQRDVFAPITIPLAALLAAADLPPAEIAAIITPPRRRAKRSRRQSVAA